MLTIGMVVGEAAAPVAALLEQTLLPALSGAMSRQLQDALARSFQAQVLPGFERATQVGVRCEV